MDEEDLQAVKVRHIVFDVLLNIVFFKTLFVTTAI